MLANILQTVLLYSKLFKDHPISSSNCLNC